MQTIRWMMVKEGPPGPREAIKGAADVYSMARTLGLHEKDREHFVVLLVDTKHKIVAAETVSIGTLNGSLIHPREVFKAAICASAAGVIAVHNHPSGDVQPSTEDRVVTKRLKDAGVLLGIPLVDHVIIGDNTFYSFRETEKGDW